MEHKLKAAELILKYMRHISLLNLSTKQENELAIKCAFEEVDSLIQLDNCWLADTSSKETSEFHYVKIALEDLTEVNKE